MANSYHCTQVKCGRMDTPRNLQAGAFAGTAEAYFRYRPPYPKALLASLVTQAHLPGSAVLLDLACGPGRVTLDLAASFEHVHAIDLEAEMIEVGLREAARRGIRNVEWRVGRAEEASIAAESVDLITIGEAFHRLDQVAIIENALDWLKPDGWIAILGTYSILAGGEAWKETVRTVARHWMTRAFPAGWADARPGTAVRPDAFKLLLLGAGFADVAIRYFVEPRDWTFDEIVGYLRSTSVCSEGALGDLFPNFEAGLKEALRPAEGRLFHEWLRCGFTMGRKQTDPHPLDFALRQD
jgi:SAM-dependent methyltransferase